MAKTAIQEMIMVLMGLLVIGMTSASAQTASLGPGEISCTTADSLSDIWFRHTYLTQRRPISATLSVTARGRYRVYVNESNVTPPLPTDNCHHPVTIDIDVSGYLRSDSNTVAILYHPVGPHDHQIAVCYYGVGRDGRPFGHKADGGWLCRPVDEGSGDGIDRGYTQTVSTACWTPVSAPGRLEIEGTKAASEPRRVEIEEAKAASAPRRVEIEGRTADSALRRVSTEMGVWPLATLLPVQVNRVTRVTAPRYSERTPEGIAYEFVTGFYGFVRLTLRGAKKGETIIIGGRKYTCNGETDEQITTAFEPTYHRRVIVSGDSAFDASQVQRVDGVSLMTTTTYNAYPY
ncbi:hypothetical protein [Prevotella sp. P5-108]|uniref:hypothetical protein n=1 Tax=Prevotella sp. P5-108 TaxID=2024225 RepID=UPI000B96E3FE|nr:hypothetical protein [Prevotella sp. P5-108]